MRAGLGNVGGKDRRAKVDSSTKCRFSKLLSSGRRHNEREEVGDNKVEL